MDGQFESNDQEEIPRHTKRFRAWGAAQERPPGPSLWARFRGWLRRIFSRKDDTAVDSKEFPVDSVGTASIEAIDVIENRPQARSSFDDLDAPWADPFPVEERRSSRPSAERPSVEDFKATWDGSYESEEEPISAEMPISVEPPAESVPESTDTDPLWDAPTVAEPTASAPLPFVENDLDEVWTPREEQETAFAAPLASPIEPPKKKGFFARLFGRKPQPDADAIADQEAAAASDWAIDIAEASSQRELEPADADFADDAAAATVPMDDDFRLEPAASSALDEMEVEVEVDMDTGATAVEEVAESIDTREEVEESEPVLEPPPPSTLPFEKRPSFIGRLFGRKSTEPVQPPPPSIDHSAEDSASLAALLGPITPVVDESLTEMMPATQGIDDEQELEVEETSSAAEEVTTSIVEETFLIVEEETTAIVENAPAFVEETLPPVEEEPPEADVEKKPGFFSSLLRRVSRSQFIPKAAVEPPARPEPSLDEQPPAEITASADVVAEGDVVQESEVVEEIYVVEEIDVVEATDVAAEIEAAEDIEFVEEIDVVEEIAEPPVEPELPQEDVDARWAPPTPASAAELDSTQPFPAFRDARDDFAAESVAEIMDSGRPTEQVELPAFDENEKTDEFEVVPGLPEADGVAAEAEPVGFFGRLFGKKAAVTGEVTGEGEAGVVPHTLVEDAGKVPFVLAKFRTFYNEVIRDKHQKSDVISGFATAIVSAGAAEMADPEFAAQLLSKRLSEMLDLQAAESNWTGGDAAKYYLEAQYAMVALADETFATTDWAGRSSWHKYMLEPKMYGTRGADIEFFKRIDKLLKDNPEPPKGARDLARVYLLVIASGFRGKFRQPGVKRPLAEYRRRLYEFAHRIDPLELYARDRRIFPEAVEHTLASQAVGRFTSAQKWVAAVLILTALYLGVSHYAWSRLSADLKDVMSRIESTDANTGGTP